MSTYGYFKNGELVAPVNLCSRFNEVGAWNLLTDEERAAYGWYPCTIVNESYDPRRQDRSTEPELTFDSETNTIIATYQIIDKDLDTVKGEMIDRIRDQRWVVETSGVTIADYRIQTDPQSQARLASLATTFLVNTTLASVNFESQPGVWVNLPRDTALKIAEIVSSYVQSCFNACMQMHDAVAACTTIDDVLNIDIYTGWPDSVYSLT